MTYSEIPQPFEIVVTTESPDSSPGLTESDKSRYLELAKLYEESWNKLRDFEWKVAFALWTATLVSTSVAVTKPETILGFKTDVDAVLLSIKGNAWVLFASFLVLLWIAYALAQYCIQSTYVYFGRNRDFYIRRITGMPLQLDEFDEEESEYPPVFGNAPAGQQNSLIWLLPFIRTDKAIAWRIRNNFEFLVTGWLSLATHVFITAVLFALAYQMILNAADDAKKKQADREVFVLVTSQNTD